MVMKSSIAGLVVDWRQYMHVCLPVTMDKASLVLISLILSTDIILRQSLLPDLTDAHL